MILRNELFLDGKIESFELEDPKAALSCHNAGASLYFRAPQPMADELVADLTLALGACTYHIMHMHAL